MRLRFGKRGNQAVFLDLEAIPRRVILKNRGPETEEKTFNRDGLIKKKNLQHGVGIKAKLEKEKNQQAESC